MRWRLRWNGMDREGWASVTSAPLPFRDFLAQRERAERSARMDKERAAFDPVLTQCVIAYVSYRAAGGLGDFDPFKREWYQTQGKEATDGR